MARRNQFVVNAESVQGNAGAEITFKLITLGTRDQYFRDPDYGDIDLLNDHILDWRGIVDDDGNEIPSPKDEPGVQASLYMSEVSEIIALLFDGQRQDLPKN
jgi:hypothetical protein